MARCFLLAPFAAPINTLVVLWTYNIDAVSITNQYFAETLHIVTSVLGVTLAARKRPETPKPKLRDLSQIPTMPTPTSRPLAAT